MSDLSIDKMLETVKSIFNATQTVVDSIVDGKRMQIKDMAEAVGIAVGMEPKKVLGFVNHFVHNTEDGFVTRGKNGGFIKGQRPVKPVKVAKADTTTTAVVATTANDNNDDSVSSVSNDEEDAEEEVAA